MAILKHLISKSSTKTPIIGLNSTPAHLCRKKHIVRLVNGGAGNFLSMAGVPSAIPRKLHADRKTIRKYCAALGNYQAIFGEDEQQANNAALKVNQLDTILTSVGDNTKIATGPLKLDRLESEVLKEFPEWYLGDIGGVWIAKRGKGARDADLVNSRWNGMQLAHLRNCAQQAKERGRAGVILVALGSPRARIVAECVRLGLVNQLIIDHDLAQQLVKS